MLTSGQLLIEVLHEEKAKDSGSWSQASLSSNSLPRLFNPLASHKNSISFNFYIFLKKIIFQQLFQLRYNQHITLYKFKVYNMLA